MKRLSVALVVLALVAAGCNGDDAADNGDTDPPENGDNGAEQTSIPVQIDGRAEEYNASMFAYFPDEVTARPGDTIVYNSVFTGEPHSITFGTVVEDAIEAFQALPPEALEAEGPPPPEFEEDFAALEEVFGAIPPMLPEGPGDAIQTSVNPCFVAEGEEIPADEDTPCPVTEPEPFTGTEIFYNSGFLADGEQFEMQLADDLEPGTYMGFCTLHFVEMISTITVVGEDEEIQTPEEAEDEGQAQLEEMAASLVPAVEAAAEEVPEGEVLAGVVDEEIRGVMANDFVPGDLEVDAGESITWNVNGPHTVSFNPPEDARVLLSRDDDGLYHLSEEAIMPAGFDAPAPPGGEPEEGAPEEGETDEGAPPEGGLEEDPEGPPPPVDAGTWDGTGFLSSGIMFGGPFMLAISEPGTYEYVCLIHPDMVGTVTVN